MKKLHAPNHKFYEQYYVDQAKQKGGNLPAFHGARFQRGYGLGSIFKGLFRWAIPHLQQGAKVIGKKALQTGVNVAQDVLGGDNIKTAISKQAKQAIGDMTSQNSFITSHASVLNQSSILLLFLLHKPLFTKGNGLNITLSATSRTLVLLNLTYLEPEKNI